MALLERRRSFRCDHCGTFSFIDTAEDPDGIQLLAPAGDALRCPACAMGMSTALLDGRQVMYCGACRGVLLPRQHFAHAVHERRAWAAGPAADPSPIEPRELERGVFCPRCAARMRTHAYLGPGSVVIDTCDVCDLVWLDVGELKQIADAPGPDRGRRGHLRRT